MTMAIPKKRICPSSSCSSCSNRRRHFHGDTMGIKPSRMSIRPNASRKASSKIYFRAGVLPGVPRMPLKNSELPGSSTITSLLLAKLDL
jgi:hypothetical protein